MRLAHLADVHLDSAFKAFSPGVARLRRQGIQNAIRAGVEHACEAEVDAILLGGDLYEHERVSPDTGAFLRELLASAAPTPVFIAPGNHDWLGPRSLYAREAWPANVHIFSEARLTPIELAPGLTLWGAAHLAPANTDGFLDDFVADRGGVNIALFHGSERGRFIFQGEGKLAHAPFSSEQIAASGLDHVFTGHFHTAIDGERLTYPGNPEPLEFGEGGDPVRGLVIATLDAGGHVMRERIRVAQTLVTDLLLAITGCASGGEIRQRAVALLEGTTGCVRVTVSGEVAPDVDLIPDDIARAAPDAMAVVVRLGSLTTTYDLEAIRTEPTVRGAFVEDVLASELSEELKQRIVVTGLRALEGRADLEVL